MRHRIPVCCCFDPLTHGSSPPSSSTVSSRTTLQYADAKQKSKAAEGSFEAAEEDVCEKVKARRDTEVLVVDQIQEEYDTAEAQLNVTAKVSGEVVRQFQANKTEVRRSGVASQSPARTLTLPSLDAQILAYKERIKNSEQELNESKAKVDKTRVSRVVHLRSLPRSLPTLSTGAMAPASRGCRQQHQREVFCRFRQCVCSSPHAMACVC